MNRRQFFGLRSARSVPGVAGLEPYTGPWTRTEAAHLVRRLQCGAMKREVDGAFNDGSASAAVNRLVDAATLDPIPEPPDWYTNDGSTGIDEVYDVQRTWLDAMRTKGLIEKMTLFWHNHFVTQWAAVDSKSGNSIGHLCYDYYSLLREHALGNFQTFVREVGLNPAMLVYLDGYVNVKGQANENYARELLELFTMGQYDQAGALNYTENDIKEIARALTGWSVNGSNKATFSLSNHDRGTKTFLGRSGAFGYDDVVDLVFETRAPQIAWYVAKKLYTFFVQAVPDVGVVQALADLLQANNWALAPTLKTLFASAHFFDASFVGGRIKSPVELVVGFLREAEVIPTADLLESLREVLTPATLGQELLNPPNVAGWPGLNPPDTSNTPGHYTWLTTTTLPERWNVLSDLIYGNLGASYDPLELATKISDPSDPFSIALDLAETMLPVPLAYAGIREVTEPFGGNPDLPPPSEILNGPAWQVNLSKILLDGTPHYEWPVVGEGSADPTDDARSLVREYLVYLIQLPAYQLT
jgi:uncharacterized protein (DUF1800 family)